MTRWPRLDFTADRAVVGTLHAYLQVVGKLPTRGLPWCNHSWHTALRVVPRGFRTYSIPAGTADAELLVDCLDPAVRLTTSAGLDERIALTGQSVAALHGDLSDLLASAGIEITIDGAPNEVEEAVPFAQDHADRAWNLEVVQRCHAAFRSVDRVFDRFRTGFVGKSSPSHLFWGSFDLALTRFSGRRAPLHPGGFPNLSDDVTREAYSHEVASAGFWLGGGGVEEAAFYAYAYPTPDGLGDRPAKPGAAYWHEQLGEFVLPYEQVRSAQDPEATLTAFLQSTYEAIAEAADWPRSDLEIPFGDRGRPYDVAARRNS